MSSTSVFILADKKSERTTVSMEEVREFVESVSEINDAIKTARSDLKNAMDGDLKLEELKVSAQNAREALKAYVENHGVYKEYSARLEELKEDKKDIIAEAKTNGIPKKEIDTAIKMLKSDIDPDSTNEIYAKIADLVE